MQRWNGKLLKIGELVAETPIVQGGMGIGISLSGLASAVANEGGIGVISAAGIGMDEPDFGTDYISANNRALRKIIRKARELTNGIIGVNIMVAARNFDELAKSAIEEGIDIIFAGAGLPLNLPSLKDASSKTKLIPIISSVRALKVITKKWIDKYNYIPDGFVLEGPMAGGHLGFSNDQVEDAEFSLEKLIVPIVEELRNMEKTLGRKIPLIAGGGVYSGEDIKRILDLGADGVQMGTRFVATHECDADIKFKEMYINAEESDIQLIKSPVGLPGRAVHNDFIDQVKQGSRTPAKCPYHCIVTCKREQSEYCIALALINAYKGKLQNGFSFAGANAWRVDRIMSVKELVDSLESEYIAALQK